MPYHIHYEVFKNNYIVWRRVDIPEQGRFVFGRKYSGIKTVSENHLIIDGSIITFSGKNGTFIYEYDRENIIGTLPILLKTLNKPEETFEDDFSKYIGKWLQLAGNTDMQSEINQWDWGTRIVICEDNKCYSNILPDFIFLDLNEIKKSFSSSKTATTLFINIEKVDNLFSLKRFETHLIDFLKLSNKKVNLTLGQIRDVRENSKNLKDYITKIYYYAQNIKSVDGNVISYHKERIECIYKLLLEESISIPKDIFIDNEVNFLRILC